MRNEIIKLITEFVKNGEKQKKEEEFFAEQLSVGRYEFYTSHAANTNPKYIYELDRYDYETMVKIVDGNEYAPRKLIHNGVEYDVLRIYSKDNAIQVTVR